MSAMTAQMRAVLIGLAMLPLGACGATTSSVSDKMTLSDMQKANVGVAILMMGIADTACPAAHVTLARKVEGGYKAVRELRIRNNWIDKGGTPQVELAPGNYHVVHWNCSNGRHVQSVGQTNKPWFGIGKKYLKSLAFFSINAGEVVNLGYLRMSKVGALGFVRFEVHDLPPRAHARLKKERPNLYARMTTRLMTVKRKPLDGEGRDAYCKLMLALREITKTPDQIPEECAGRQSGL